MLQKECKTMSTWIKKKVNGIQEMSDKDTPKNFQEIR